MVALAYAGNALPDGYRELDVERGYKITNVFGASNLPDESPQVFLVDVIGGWSIRPHYHDVPQFQIVVRGSGRMGKHEFAAPFVHFADGWTSYGPIEAGEEGMSFFTARASADTGAHYMPEERARLMQTSRGQQAEAALRPYGAAATGETTAECIPARADALAADDRVWAPGEAVDLGAAVGAIRRMLLVLEGSVSLGDQTYGPYSWFCDSEVALHLVAGDAGARILHLSTPAIVQTGKEPR